MTTTSIWVPLVVALLGLGGILYTQRRADRRADSERARELEREKVRGAREDAARSYEHRRAAYADFIKEYHHRVIALINERLEERGTNDVPLDYLDGLHGSLTQIEIFGTTEAAKRAQEVFDASLSWVFRDGEGSPPSLRHLLNEIRRDLAIPASVPGPPEPP